jgi:hypothetical protein
VSVSPRCNAVSKADRRKKSQTQLMPPVALGQDKKKTVMPKQKFMQR